MVMLGASAPDAIHAQVSAPRHRPYSASARARRKHAYSSACEDPAARFPSPAGQQRPRRLAALVGNRPEPGQQPAPAARLQGHRVGLHRGQRVRAVHGPSASSSRSRSARHGWENV